MPLKLQIDAEAIADQLRSFTTEMKNEMKKAVGNLATLTRTRIAEAAQEELDTSRHIYMEALSDPEEEAPGVWVISLDQKGMWIEEGIQPNKDMKPDLLKGAKYKVIPFRYDKPQSQNSNYTQGLITEIKQQLRKQGVPYKKIEYNKDGSPKVGKLHEFNFGNPGGKMGAPGKGNTPALAGLTIYQREQGGKIKRDILTFRTVSSTPASSGKWIHPGFEAKKFMDRAMIQAIDDWENQILPELMQKWSNK